ncbi:hypothetical protein D3C87_1915880 [compost metagenome]
MELPPAGTVPIERPAAGLPAAGVPLTVKLPGTYVLPAGMLSVTVVAAPMLPVLAICRV